jgi:hypothetical protein
MRLNVARAHPRAIGCDALVIDFRKMALVLGDQLRALAAVRVTGHYISNVPHSVSARLCARPTASIKTAGCFTLLSGRTSISAHGLALSRRPFLDFAAGPFDASTAFESRPVSALMLACNYADISSSRLALRKTVFNCSYLARLLL